MPARRRTPAPTTTFRGAPAARQGPARVHPWGLRRAAAFRAPGRARSSERYSGGLAPAPPPAPLGRTPAFMPPPAGPLTCPEPPYVRARRGPTVSETPRVPIGVLLAWHAGHAARRGPARVHPWGLRRAAAFRASGRARASARYSGGIAPAQPDATVGRTSACMQPPAGALTCAEPPMVRARRGHTMTEAHLFAIGVLLAWLAGIRVYLTVFGIGLAGFFGWLDLPQALEVTASPWVLGVSGVLAIAEFFADKIPGVDSGWDLLHTLLRVPAGAFLAAATLSPDGDLGAGMLATGAGVALTSHLLKSGARAMMNTSPDRKSTRLNSSH